MNSDEKSSDVAFSPAIKAVQEARGSRKAFARRADWPTRVTPDLAAFIAEIRSFYLATSSADRPAHCTGCGAQTNENCCSLVICCMSFSGPCIQPSRDRKSVV